MRLPNSDNAARLKAEKLLERLQTMQFDWPFEPELRGLDESVVDALLELADENHKAQLERRVYDPLLTLMMCCSVLSLFVLPGALKWIGPILAGVGGFGLLLAEKKNQNRRLPVVLLGLLEVPAIGQAANDIVWLCCRVTLTPLLPLW